MNEATYPKTIKARKQLFDQVLEAGREGKSHAQIAAMIGIGRDTLNIWVMEFSEFARIMVLSDDFALAWWEGLGQRQAETREGNSTVFMFIMKNRFGQDYSKDSKNVDATGAVDSADITEDLAALSAEKREALRALLRA